MAYDESIKVISVPISKEAHDALVLIAKRDKRSKTSQAGFLLEQILSGQKKKKDRRTKE